MRARTGTVVKTRDGRWQPVISMTDGSRKRLPPCESEDAARAAAIRESAVQAGRPRTGQVVSKSGRFFARVRSGSGRKLIGLPRGINEDEAKRLAFQLSQGTEVAADPGSDPFRTMPMIAGARFGRWVLVSDGTGSGKRVDAICECGHRASLLKDELRRRKTMQCRGCRANMMREAQASFAAACEKAMRSNSAVEFASKARVGGGQASATIPDYAVIGGVFLSAADLADLFAMTTKRLRAEIAKIAKMRRA